MKNLIFWTVSIQGGGGLCSCQLWTISFFSLSVNINCRLVYMWQDSWGEGWVGVEIHIHESFRAGPFPQQHLAEDQLSCCLSPHLLCLQGIHPAGILLGCVLLHGSLNSSCPLSWPQFCSMLITMLSVQPFNGAFIRFWVNGFNVLSGSWRVKLWCEVLSSIVCFPELSVNCVTLTTKGWQCWPVSYPTRIQNAVTNVTSLDWATGIW